MCTLHLKQAQEQCRLEEEKIKSLVLSAERLESHSSVDSYDILCVRLCCFWLLNFLNINS